MGVADRETSKGSEPRKIQLVEVESTSRAAKGATSTTSDRTAAIEDEHGWEGWEATYQSTTGAIIAAG
jgi:hypothetical protein